MKTKIFLISIMAALSAGFCFAQNVAATSLITVESPTWDQEFQMAGSNFNNAGYTAGVETVGDSAVRLSLDSKKSFVIQFSNHGQAARFKSFMEQVPGKYKFVIPGNWPLTNDIVVNAVDVKIQELQTGKPLGLLAQFDKRERELTNGQYGFLDLMNKYNDQKSKSGTFSVSHTNAALDSNKSDAPTETSIEKTEAGLKVGHF